MRRIDSIIIGGGQAGLAMSRCLTDLGIEHVVLERGRVGERWRSERWDSLHLLTPRWQSRLPGYAYDGPDPDGYMSRTEVVSYLERYSRTFPAPVETGVTVTSVRQTGDEYHVDTDRGSWSASNVVVATGDCDVPLVPEMSKDLSGDIHQVVPSRYKNPSRLPDGGVLVVGASATGVQLAAEIHASGRPVTLAVGRHTRMPRTYRGKDILWWLDKMGALDERAEDVKDLEVSRGQPSLQLIGSPDRRTVDLRSLMASGVRLTGRAGAAEGSLVMFEDDLVENAVAADAKLAKLRARIDAFVRAMGIDGEIEDPEPLLLTEVPEVEGRLDLRAEGIRTVLWATGFRRSYSWLHVPVLDARGEIIHTGGVTPQRGLYVMGLRFLRRRNSSFIDGQAKDAAELSEHLARRSRTRTPALISTAA